MKLCPACHGKKFRLYQEIQGYPLYLCLACKLLITEVNEEKRKQFNRRKYTKAYAQGYELAIYKMTRRFNKHIQLIKQHMPTGRLLDIGCGTGHLLKFLKSHTSSWKLFGVEPDTTLRIIAGKVSGLEIKKGALNKIPFPNNYFDVITCYDVLEHSIELQDNCNELRRVLKPDGILFIQAPNYLSFMRLLTGHKWDWWCIPDHLLHFSYKWLTHFLNKRGFVIVNSFTYEDVEDFKANIKGVSSINILTKFLYVFSLPFLMIIRRCADTVGYGGLSVVIAKKV